MKEIKVKEKEEGQRLDKYLKRLLPLAKPSLLYKMLRKKNILLNRHKAEGSEKLNAGDTVTLYFSDESFDKLSQRKEETVAVELPVNPEVLFETEDLLILDKPAGILSQRAKAEDISLNEWLRDRYPAEGNYRPSCLNRLDRNTSGLVLAAKNLKGAMEGSRWLAEGTLTKRYRALVVGRPDEQIEGSAYLVKDRKTNLVRVSETKDSAEEGSSLIRFCYERIKTIDRYSLLSITILTGKSHQIRAHLSMLGFPILGDPKYGDSAENRLWKKRTGLDRQLLHAAELVLPTGERIRSDLPADFLRVMEALEK
ncbi:MAG: RluA family pseudouridine synthase [Lachnospiraceae bacterium]|nr:RluA family pseudouridine synthase [Lachnospiraceae bacterium]